MAEGNDIVSISHVPHYDLQIGARGASPFVETAVSDSRMDIISPTQRSQLMGRIRGKGTKPELVVRKAAHRLGSRFRLYRNDLPGSPDLVFPSRRLALFVHGCFWHRHTDCRYCYNPKSNIEFWKKKFKNNVARDKRVRGELERMDWRVAIVWECETRDAEILAKRLMEYLGR